MANWISKPVSALSPNEQSLWRSMGLSNPPLSQDLSWGRAAMAIGSGAWVVFSPERRVSALFLISGDEAECVNGPVLDWPRIDSARELNEQLGMAVYALHQACPGLKSIRLRPRLSPAEFEFLRAHSAFPVDRIDRACTSVIPLRASQEEQWRSLPGRIRHEVSRSFRAGVRVTERDAGEDLAGFWNKVLPFYAKRGLYAPGPAFMEAMLGGGGIRGRVFTAALSASGVESEAGILVVDSGETGFYLYAYEERAEGCPNVSLNAPAQWEALKHLIGQGVRRYDLNGILHPQERSLAPEGPDLEGFRGVDAYKRKFKGDAVEYVVPSLGFGGL